MGARWHSPELTRFLSPDPLPGELDKPLSQNPYLYCGDDPINSFDPAGKGPLEELERQIESVTRALIKTQDAIHLYIRGGMEPPSCLMNTRAYLERTLQHLWQAYRLLSLAKKISGKAEEYGLLPGASKGRKDCGGSAQDIVRKIVGAVRAENEAALAGSLGRIRDAAMNSTLWDFKQSNAWYLQGLSEEEREALWRGLRRELVRGYIEVIKDGDFRRTVRWDNGIPMVVSEARIYSGDILYPGNPLLLREEYVIEVEKNLDPWPGPGPGSHDFRVRVWRFNLRSEAPEDSKDNWFGGVDYHEWGNPIVHAESGREIESSLYKPNGCVMAPQNRSIYYIVDLYGEQAVSVELRASWWCGSEAPLFVLWRSLHPVVSKNIPLR